MHALLSVAALCAASVIACSTSTQPQTSPGAVKPDSNTSAPCVLVELFTSEGCSSCPPADKVLADLPAAVSGVTVIPLAFHVDYWDYIGWKDRFATPAYTQRQRQYAEKLDSGTYTPQMIVAGHDQFVGSDKSAAIKAIRAASAPTVPLTIAINPRKAGEPVSVKVTLGDNAKMPPHARLFAALTEDHLSTEVKRGENASRTLKHEGVVRAFTRADANGEAKENRAAAANEPGTTLTLTPPSDMKESNGHVVVFVQDEQSLAVLGAATTALAASK